MEIKNILKLIPVVTYCYTQKNLKKNFSISSIFLACLILVRNKTTFSRLDTDFPIKTLFLMHYFGSIATILIFVQKFQIIAAPAPFKL